MNKLKFISNFIIIFFMINFIIVGLIPNIFGISNATQTSNNLYFLSVGEAYYESKSNELIPNEGPAIWHIKTNFDNECIYILFDIMDTTNPDNKNLDHLTFYIDFSNNNYLSDKSSFGFYIQRNLLIKYYRYNTNQGNFVEVCPPDDGSMGTIHILPSWKVYYVFNYSQFGYPKYPKNQTIKLMAIYTDHIIGSIILDYKYPSLCNSLLKSSWATGYFIEGYSNNDAFVITIWILIFIIIAGFALISYKQYKSSSEFQKFNNNRPKNKTNSLLNFSIPRLNEEDSGDDDINYEIDSFEGYEPW
ncbi:MAG: hypothetical protein ACTSWR_10560 [Candidatus Helarchaeota archaeon]